MSDTSHSLLPDFENIFESIPGTYLILSPDLTIRAVNDAYVKATMTKREDIIGLNIFDVFPESTETSTANSVERVRTSFLNVFKEKAPDKLEALRFDVLNPDDPDKGFVTRYWTLVTLPVINKRTKEVEYLVSSVEDVTEMVRLQSAEKSGEDRFFKIFNLSPEPKAITRMANGTFLYVNAANEKMTGWKPEEMIGKTSADLNMVEEEERNRIRELMKASGGRLRDVELKIRTKSGEERFAYVNVELIELDGEWCALTNYVDITERRIIEAEIRSLNNELENKVRQLEAVNHEMEAFSYSVSHDLRAPLRAINGYAQILTDEYGASIDPDALTMMNAIRKNAKKMDQLIDDLLAFSRLGKKEIQRTQMSMETAVQSVLTEFKNNKLLMEKVNVTVHSLPSVHADFNLMLQVWMNLLSNAIKYSGKKEKQQIEIGTTTKNGNTVFYIKDNGVGFDMKYYGKLFGVFQRLHRTEEFEGTGVGLALVQRIIIKHNGKVWAEAEVDKGATFYFTLEE